MAKASKLFRYVLYFILFCVLLRACGAITLHDHEWQEATCTTAKTCSVCGDTEGDPLGHHWTEATCIAPKTCSVCGETVGVPSKHDWIKATCEVPKTCSVCGAQDGEALGHHYYSSTWYTTLRPTCQTEGERTNTCSRCGAPVTESIPVINCTPGSWQVVEDVTTSTLVTKAQYCTMCGAELDRKEITLSGSGGNGDNGVTTSGNNFNAHNNEGQQQTTASYVLNTSTMKFHRPSCRDVPRIATQNYATSSQSRADLIARGYSPCGHCNP